MERKREKERERERREARVLHNKIIRMKGMKLYFFENPFE